MRLHPAKTEPFDAAVNEELVAGTAHNRDLRTRLLRGQDASEEAGRVVRRDGEMDVLTLDRRAEMDALPPRRKTSRTLECLALTRAEREKQPRDSRLALAALPNIGR